MTDTSPPLFDKLRYFDRLTRAGIGEDQARAHAEAMEEALRDSVATSADLRSAVQTLRGEMQTLKHDLTVRAGLMSVAMVAVLASLKLFG